MRLAGPVVPRQVLVRRAELPSVTPADQPTMVRVPSHARFVQDRRDVFPHSECSSRAAYAALASGRALTWSSRTSPTSRNSRARPGPPSRSDATSLGAKGEILARPRFRRSLCLDRLSRLGLVGRKRTASAADQRSSGGRITTWRTTARIPPPIDSSGSRASPRPRCFTASPRPPRWLFRPADAELAKDRAEFPHRV